MVNRKELESLVVDRIKTRVLTEKNLMEIFNIALDQINSNKRNHAKELNNINGQLEGLRERLGKLYNSLETGKLEIEHIAPRIKEIKTQIDAFEAQRGEITNEMQNPATLPFNLKSLNNYAQDLAEILKDGTIMEQKAVIRSFVKRIVITRPDITLDYTMPIVEEEQKEIGRTTETAVLPMLQIGSPHWLTEKVFSVTFQFEPKPTPIPKPQPTYRNPIFRAKEYARMIESGQAKNESDLARKIGVSRVRVCQYVRLLYLDGSVIKALERLGDPLTKRVITERLLRPYLKLDTKEQRNIIINLLTNHKS